MDEKEKSQNQNMTENSGTAEKPKKKKGWLKILLIVLIVLVCIAAVIGIYAVSQKDNAEEAALSHAKVSRSEVSGLYSDLELDGLTPVSYTHLDVYKRQNSGRDPPCRERSSGEELPRSRE